jgi:hypothetical protein
MSANPDFRDLFSILNTCGAKYLVVGAHAVMHYAEPRYTKDLDIWIDPEPGNAVRVWRALAEFGAPLEGVTLADLSNPVMVYQIGMAPNRIDVMMGVPGVRFPTAWKRRVRSSYGGVRIAVLHRQDLIRAKRAAGRPQDLLDIAALRHSATKRRTHEAHPSRRARAPKPPSIP